MITPSPTDLELEAAANALFKPHPNLSDAINSRLCQAEVDGGIQQEELNIGAILEIETDNRVYRLINCEDGYIRISGHPQFCPDPIKARVHGSTWGGSMIKSKYIGRGMRLEFKHPTLGVVITSWIKDIREVDPGHSRFSFKRRKPPSRPMPVDD